MRSDEATSEENTSQGFPIGDFRRPSFSSGYLQDGKPVYGKTVSRSNSFILTADIRLITVIYWMRMFVWTVRLIRYKQTLFGDMGCRDSLEYT